MMWMNKISQNYEKSYHRTSSTLWRSWVPYWKSSRDINRSIIDYLLEKESTETVEEKGKKSAGIEWLAAVDELLLKQIIIRTKYGIIRILKINYSFPILLP